MSMVKKPSEDVPIKEIVLNLRKRHVSRSMKYMLTLFW